MSGHSKWNNIKRKKEKTDAARAKIFTKIGKEMAVAIRAGGPNPASNSKLRELIAYLSSMGFAPETVSGGSTGTAQIKAQAGLYTELQAGSYLFMDATYRDLALPFENSLFVLATVVSTNDRMAVVDAGVKSCGVDQGMPVPVGFTVDHVVASEEHFQLHAPSKHLKIGDKVLLIPGHCCSTVNLHNEIFLVEDERVIDRIPVTSRGGFR